MKLRARHPAMLAGLAVFTVAVGVVVGMEVGADVTAGLVEAAGNDYVVLAVFGAIALLLVFVVALSRALFGQEQAEPPDPEGVQTAPHPGAEFDRVVDEGLSLRTQLFGDDGEGVRERLRRAAVEVVMRGEIVARDEARDRVYDGSWTGNDAAAAFLAADGDRSPPLSARLMAAFRGRTSFQHGAEAAADEIARQAGVYAPESSRGERGVTRGSSDDDLPPPTASESTGNRDDPPKSIRQAAADGGRTADTVGSAHGGEDS
jgi:hypothetical protein